MYTRCPSCRAEICFDPPANAANLPEGYKHKIRCPNCGVTIGVKIPSATALAQTQPTFTPQNPYADRPEQAYRAEVKTEKADKYAGKVQKKLSGRPRSFGCFIFGVLLLATVILGYLAADMLSNVEALAGLRFFDGLTLLSDTAALKAAFEVGVADGLVACLPVIFFFAAALTAVAALVCFAVGKFPRYLNFVWSMGMLALSACIVFQPYLGSAPIDMAIAEYFVDVIIGGSLYLVFVPVALALVYMIFSFGFMVKPMKKWVPAAD